jgi:hypothetical protein
MKGYYDEAGTVKRMFCASCGIKEMVATKSAHQRANKSTEYNWGTFSVQELLHMEKLKVANGIDQFSTKYQENGISYHLYPDLIIDKKFSLCSSCVCLTKGKVPDLSLASKKFDFGQVNLPQLSFLESLLISQNIVHIHLLKINYQNPTAVSETIIKGNCICIPHNGFVNTATKLPRTDVTEFFTVKFNGNKQFVDVVKQQVLTKSMFKVRVRVLRMWINFLIENNPYYSGIEKDESFFNRDVDFIQYRDSIHSEILFDMEHTDDPNALNQEEMQSSALIDDDVAQESFQFTYIDNMKNHETVDAEKNIISQFTNHIIDPLDEDSSKVLVELFPNQAVNEFESFKRIIYSSFPALFPLGRGFPRNVPHSVKETRKLLLFYDQRFSNCQQFLFYIFNVKMRHHAIKSCSLYVNSNPKSIEDICKFITEPGLLDKLKYCQSNPDSKIATEMALFLTKHIRAASHNLPFSSAERNLNLSQLIGYCRHFGTPSWFITISPSDSDSALIVSMATSKTIEQIKKTINVDRKLITNENPVVAAEIFYRTMTHMFEILIGMPTNNTVRKKHPSLETRNKGIFGTPLAYFGVIETQGRGSLHIHFALWTKINSTTMQRLAGSDLQDMLRDAVDSMTCSSIPESFHLENKQRLDNRDPLLRFSFDSTFQIPNSLEMEDALIERSNQIAVALQTHHHSKTCHKGKVGKTKCRLSRPQPVIDITAPVVLKRSQSNEIIANRVVPPFDELWDDENPFPDDDSRLIYWHTKRATISNPTVSNGNIVEFNRILTSILASNTCVSLLGDSIQAKTTTFYMLKYMTKDPIALASTLSTIVEACNKVNIPSTAADASEHSRKAKLFLQRTLNSMIGHSEYGQTLCAAVLLGHQSTIKSHNLTWCFSSGAIKSFKECNSQCDSSNLQLDDNTEEVFHKF